MTDNLKAMVRASAVLAFVCCLGGGVWILSQVGIKHGSDAVWTGLGLYFIGKAFFVGPMLWVAAEQVGKR